VTYQKKNIPPTNLAKKFGSSKLDVSALKSSMQVHLDTILLLKKGGKQLFFKAFFV